MKIFHHDDHDGYLSKFWITQAIEKNQKITKDPYGIKYYEMSYAGSSKSFPFDEIQKDENIIVVDYKLYPEDYEKFLKITKNILYIDHHIESIKILKEYCHKSNISLPIGFYINGVSASALTALWFFSDLFMVQENPDEHTLKSCVQNLPLFAQYVNDYDVWNLKMVPDSNNFMLGSDSKIKDMTFWHNCFNDSYTMKIVEIGSHIQNYVSNKDSKRYNKFKHVVEINDPKYKEFNGLSIVILNSGQGGAPQFGDGINAYDLCISYTISKNKVDLGLYSNKEKVDCAKLAKSLNPAGGGHKGAAGCSLTIKDFFNIFKHEGI